VEHVDTARYYMERNLKEVCTLLCRLESLILVEQTGFSGLTTDKNYYAVSYGLISGYSYAVIGAEFPGEKRKKSFLVRSLELC
jgi:hypothetical protein